MQGAWSDGGNRYASSALLTTNAANGPILFAIFWRFIACARTLIFFGYEPPLATAHTSRQIALLSDATKSFGTAVAPSLASRDCEARGFGFVSHGFLKSRILVRESNGRIRSATASGGPALRCCTARQSAHAHQGNSHDSHGSPPVCTLSNNHNKGISSQPATSNRIIHLPECPVSSYSRGASICGWIRAMKSRAWGERYLPLRITTP